MKGRAVHMIILFFNYSELLLLFLGTSCHYTVYTSDVLIRQSLASCCDSLCQILL